MWHSCALCVTVYSWHDESLDDSLFQKRKELKPLEMIGQWTFTVFESPCAIIYLQHNYLNHFVKDVLLQFCILLLLLSSYIPLAQDAHPTSHHI